MQKCKILVFIGCRSDEGLSAPVLRRLEENPNFICEVATLYPSNFKKSYELSKKIFESEYYDAETDIALITGDRVEMMAAALACFHKNIPIAHLYAGITNTFATFDDIHRHQITLMSDVIFCEDERSYINVLNMLDVIKKEALVSIVGITHLDDLRIDLSLVPEKEYDLALINSTTLKEDSLDPLIYERDVISIEPNPDCVFSPAVNLPVFKFRFDTLPRSQFLGLLKNCTRFITNSSAAYYEAPYFLESQQIILVGERNKNRSTDFNRLQKGASDKIIKILGEWWRRKTEE